MQRDNSRLEVPPGASLRPTIERLWREIMSRLYDGLPYDESLRFAERLLQERQDEIHSETLDRSYDWQYDLQVAKFHHQWNLDHRKHNEEARERYQKYWENILEQNRAILKEIGLSGLKTILLIHGAVALGALNIIAQSDSEKIQIILAAKLGLAFSLIGIALVGLGQLIMFIKMTEINSKLASKLSAKIRWNKLRAFWRYYRRHTQVLKIANYAIYGSILWFCAYCVILYIVIVS
jgi:hypothetical protein